jgi:SRSO17 transposase
MLERALDAGVRASWVTADAVHGSDRKLRLWLDAQCQPFVLAVTGQEALWMPGGKQVRVAKTVAALAEEQWQRLSCGQGAKGARLYEWAR